VPICGYIIAITYADCNIRSTGSALAGAWCASSTMRFLQQQFTSYDPFIECSDNAIDHHPEATP
jgi:hypothetical protein